MLKQYRTELDVTEAQAQKIRDTIRACRVIYNLYLADCQSRLAAKYRPLSAYTFESYFNHTYLPAHPELGFIKKVSSKAVSHAIQNAERAYRDTGHIKSKDVEKMDSGMYFGNSRLDTPHPGIEVERHRIKIPTLSWVKLKEKGYIPTDRRILSGTVTVKAGRYYVSVVVEEDAPKQAGKGPGIGIDLGVKNLAILSTGAVYGNINDTKAVRKVLNQLQREKRSLARKYAAGSTDASANVQTQLLRIDKLNQRLANIRMDYQFKCISDIMDSDPAYVTLEDLNVSEMLKSGALGTRVAQQWFHGFRRRLTDKAKERGVEVRIVPRWYPSSKTCHACGYVNHGLTLDDRTFTCPVCGAVIDRDLNAALNLRDATGYRVVA